MCTVTWLAEGASCEVFFNRDEQRTRLPARPPVLKQRDGLAVLAPEDGNHGGTWIGANALGLTVCILNHQPDPFPPVPEPRKSRGWLVDSLLPAASPADVGARLAGEPMDGYGPFILVALDSGARARSWTWDGKALQLTTLDPGALPLTTSSFDPVNVRAHRRNTYERLRATWGGVSHEMLLAFHQQHDPAAGAQSVCMAREDARTVSFSHISVTDTLVTFRYWDVPPCERQRVDPVITTVARRHDV